MTLWITFLFHNLQTIDLVLYIKDNGIIDNKKKMWFISTDLQIVAYKSILGLKINANH
jgi:hypothetical protein